MVVSGQVRSVGRWRPDTEVAGCEACKRRFSILVRRHHCRECGNIFCAACSSHQRVIPAIDHFRKQRVCDACFRARPLVLPGASRGASRPAPKKQQQQPRTAGSAPVKGESPVAAQHKGTADAPPPSSAAATAALASTASTAVAPTGSERPSHGLTDDPATARGNPSRTTSSDDGGDREAAAAGAPREVIVGTHAVAMAGADLQSPTTVITAAAAEAVGGGGVSSSVVADSCSDASSDDGFGTPPDIASLLVSGSHLTAPPGVGASERSIATNLSILNTLHDALRPRKSPCASRGAQSGGDRQLRVLLYPGPGRETSIWVPVAPGQTMGDILVNLTENFFQLLHGPFRRPTPDDLAALQSELVWCSETAVIPRDVPAADLLHHQKRVVLSTEPRFVSETASPFASSRTMATPQVSYRNIPTSAATAALAGNSIREFFRSETSNNADGGAADHSGDDGLCCDDMCE